RTWARLSRWRASGKASACGPIGPRRQLGQAIADFEADHRAVIGSADRIADRALDAVPLRENRRNLVDRALARDAREQARHDIDHEFKAGAIAGTADLAGEGFAQPVL